MTYRPKENAICYHAACTPQLLLTRTLLSQPQSLRQYPLWNDHAIL
jgi:hypothetical protein